MPYLIDGHNLIPKIPGLSLQEPDDEEHLIALLQRFANRSRLKLIVYFDRAATGHAGERSYGGIRVHFVPLGSTADQAIIAHIRRLGGDAHNWTVVSSDHMIQSEVRARGAKVVSSEEFAEKLEKTLSAPPGPAGEREDLSDAEVEEWLRLFENKGKPVKKSLEKKKTPPVDS